MNILIEVFALVLLLGVACGIGYELGKQQVAVEDMECVAFDGGKVVCISEGKTTNDSGI